MILSKETLNILKNFAEINSNFLFREGNYIATTNDKVIAYAKIDEHIPRTFGIYDLNNFLAILNIDKSENELEFSNGTIVIKGLNGRSSIKYTTTNPSMLLVPMTQDEKIKASGGKIKRTDNPEYLIPNYDALLPKFNPSVTLILSKEDYERISKVSRILGNTHIAIENDGNEVRIVAFNPSNPLSNTNSIKLDIPVAENVYKLIFTIEKFNIFPGNYEVTISEKGMSKFKCLDRELVYFITLESSSYYK